MQMAQQMQQNSQEVFEAMRVQAAASMMNPSQPQQQPGTQQPGLQQPGSQSGLPGTQQPGWQQPSSPEPGLPNTQQQGLQPGSQQPKAQTLLQGGKEGLANIV